MVEEALPLDTLRDVVAEIDPWEAKVESALQALPEKRMFIARAGEIPFTTHRVLRSDQLRSVCAEPLFQELGHDLGLVGFCHRSSSRRPSSGPVPENNRK